MIVKFHIFENVAPDQHMIHGTKASLEEALGWVLDGDATNRGVAFR